MLVYESREASERRMRAVHEPALANDHLSRRTRSDKWGPLIAHLLARIMKPEGGVCRLPLSYNVYRIDGNDKRTSRISQVFRTCEFGIWGTLANQRLHTTINGPHFV